MNILVKLNCINDRIIIVTDNYDDKIKNFLNYIDEYYSKIKMSEDDMLMLVWSSLYNHNLQTIFESKVSKEMFKEYTIDMVIDLNKNIPKL